MVRSACLIVLVLLPAPARAQVRSWTDRSGAFTVEAEFVESRDNVVQLKKPDQTTISVPLDRLSKKDQDHVAILLECGALVEDLRSQDRPARVEAAESLLKKAVLGVAVAPILDFVKLEIAAWSSAPIESSSHHAGLPFLGEEISLAKIRSDPKAYVGKAFVVVGGIDASTHYTLGYQSAEKTHDALKFDEWDKAAKATGEYAYLYVPRTFGALLIERIAQTKEKGLMGTLVRVKATLDPKRYQGPPSCYLMEVLDWQVLDHETRQWIPWTLEGFSTGIALLAKLQASEALAALATSENAYGPEAVDSYVRTTAAAKLGALRVDLQRIGPIVAVIASQKLHGSEETDRLVRNAAIGVLAKLDAGGRGEAGLLLEREHSEATASGNDRAADWANQALRRLGTGRK